VGALAAIVQSLENTQPSQQGGDEVVNDTAKEISKIAKDWEKQIPSKMDMQKTLKSLHDRLQKDLRQEEQPRNSESQAAGSGMQSFYTGFVKKLQEDKDNDGEWNVKGKGKGGKSGKGKAKGKAGKSESGLPQFELKRICPQREITSWQQLAKELDGGREPTGNVAIIDCLDRAAEFQSLAAEHQLKQAVLMVIKTEVEQHKTLKNARRIWIPYIGNPALVRATIAMTDSSEPKETGLQPLQVKATEDKQKEDSEFVTLRIIVDLNLLEDEGLKDFFKDHPHKALHEALVDSSCKELRTTGWKQHDNVLTGYCNVPLKDTQELMAHSGKGGCFMMRLKKDILQHPHVTWVPPLKSENPPLIISREHWRWERRRKLH